MLRILARIRDWNLVRAERALDLLAVDLLGPALSLQGSEDHHGPRGALRWRGGRLDSSNVLVRAANDTAHVVVDVGAAIEEQGLVPVAAEERRYLFLAHGAEDRGVRDLVSVEEHDRQHGAVGLRVHELVPVPRCRRRAGFRLAVADDACDQERWIVERGPVRG